MVAITIMSCEKDDFGNKGSVCTTCTERNSGYSQKYCGSPSEVDFFERELKRQGSNLGQNWNCKR
jgi:hypothetical protein